ncbi:MAG: hypothetical protein O3C03_10760 [Proteobacteria bacterium]|nr:hypothetical protein [Pseudomonadota bacterium]MDA0869672.1 hypothetical protein [Pseudomonadota bacterium]MDA1329405.1 hypothetical protein [Pseudomonadota bacterium]
MVKLIGWVVLAAVLVVGWDAWVRWYDGEASAQQTVQEVRRRLGDLITPDTPPPAAPAPAAPESAPTDAPRAPVHQAPPDRDSIGAWRAWLRQLLE